MRRTPDSPDASPAPHARHARQAPRPTRVPLPRAPRASRRLAALVVAAVGAGAALASGAAPLRAQNVARVTEPAPAWLGISYEARWLQHGDRCEPRVVVEGVVHGSPAERAGLRPGDAIVAVDGRPAPATRLRGLAARLAPGDSVRLRFQRGGAVREVTAVADRRPARPPTVVVRAPGDGLYRSSAPVARLRGDTLEAWNVEPSSPWGGALSNGYWLARPDGSAEYRRLSAWSDDPVDQRVAGLLACADTLHVEDGELPMVVARASAAPTHVSVQRIRDRADSLRVVIARRALEAAAPRPPRAPAAPGAALAPGAPGAEPRVLQELQIAGPGSYVFRFEDRAAFALRGVAGAEVTTLEPELAEYFRGARDGVLVLRVAEGSPADRAGLRPGDVIVRAGRRTTESVDELRQILDRRGWGELELGIVRKGRDRTLRLRRD